MFRAHVLIIRRSKLHYTASGIITPIGVMIPEAEMYGQQNVKICDLLSSLQTICDLKLLETINNVFIPSINYCYISL